MVSLSPVLGLFYSNFGCVLSLYLSTVLEFAPAIRDCMISVCTIIVDSDKGSGEVSYVVCIHSRQACVKTE